MNKGFGNQHVAGSKKIAPSWRLENRLPSVSVCTVTFNRSRVLPLLEQRLREQDYPHSLIEWVVVEDSDDGVSWAPSVGLPFPMTYRRFPEHLTLGRKRNLSHHFCAGEVIVYMDDDDYYPASRISHAVQKLRESEALMAGSTILPILFLPEHELWISGPFAGNHATANTFAFCRELLKFTRYDDQASHAEERSFLADYTLPMVQLDADKTILCMAHNANTFEKRKMIQNGAHSKMKPWNVELHPLLLNSISDYQAAFAI
jgi:glycosyltransferase involved in cell wall biosynthesis